VAVETPKDRQQYRDESASAITVQVLGCLGLGNRKKTIDRGAAALNL
jgi:hypothetical protein